MKYHSVDINELLPFLEEINTTTTSAVLRYYRRQLKIELPEGSGTPGIDWRADGEDAALLDPVEELESAYQNRCKYFRCRSLEHVMLLEGIPLHSHEEWEIRSLSKAIVALVHGSAIGEIRANVLVRYGLEGFLTPLSLPPIHPHGKRLPKEDWIFEETLDWGFR